MRRTFNSTGRRKINLKDFDVQLTKSQEQRAAVLNYEDDILSDYPSDSKIQFEIMGGLIIQKIPYGTVGEPLHSHPTELDTRISVDSDPTFRIRIIRPDTGLVLGQTAKFSASNSEGEGTEPKPKWKTLLPVAVKDIDEVWSLDYQVEKGAILVISSKRMGGKEVANSVKYEMKWKQTIYPAAIRQVLYKIILVEKNWNFPYFDKEQDESDQWSGWARWAKSLIADKDIEPGFQTANESRKPELAAEWIEDVVSAYCQSAELDLQFYHGGFWL